MSGQHRNNPGNILAGVIYDAESPEFIGTMPIRHDLTVLPADQPGRKPVGFMFQQYSGGEVFKEKGAFLTKESDLCPGDRVWVPTLIGTILMTVIDTDEGLMAESGSTLADLEFDQDDRHCWTSSMAFNKKALERI